MTQSERVFERFCGARGLRLHRIPEGKLRSPDYYLEASGKRVVVEVKQIDANKEERLVLRKAPDEWNQDDRILMTVYHNWHARIPLERQVLTLPGVEQFELEHAPDNRFCQWKKTR